jgi:hypothetical protein
LSFKFIEHRGEYDCYEIVFAPDVNDNNLLLSLMKRGSAVLLHHSSFPFAQIHKRVFDSYSMLRAGNIVETHAKCLENLVTSFILFGGAQRFLNARLSQEEIVRREEMAEIGRLSGLKKTREVFSRVAPAAGACTCINLDGL